MYVCFSGFTAVSYLYASNPEVTEDSSTNVELGWVSMSLIFYTFSVEV